ncbi:TVP38/TMEM64 family protein [Bacillaceae bacterium S4-13-58]
MNKSFIILFGLIVLVIPVLTFFPSVQKGIFLLMDGDSQGLIAWIRSWGMLAPILSIFLMVLQAIAAPLPAFLITGANGMVFGIFWGVIISWIGATAGATVSYYLAKIFGKTVIPRKYQDKKWLKKWEQVSEKHGFTIVLVSRLIPVVSFDFISYAAGFTRMRISHFLFGTGIGMIPGTIIYTIIGHDFLQLEDYKGRFIILLLLLTFLFVIGLWVRKRYIKNNE